MEPGENHTHKSVSTSGIGLSLAFVSSMLAISLSACSQSQENRQAETSSRSLLSLHPKADPATVQRIIDEERKQAERQAQAAIYAETAGAEQSQPGLGRNLPNVSREPFSYTLIAPPADSVNADGSIIASHNDNSHPSAQLASYQPASYNQVASYNTVPPPPPGALGGGLVPPPPAVTLSTQAQAIADSTAAFYNNPYFNPFAVPAPPQSSAPSRRPSGLFGEGNAHDQYDNAGSNQKRKADFVPITPKGMEARSPYKQRDDLRILWKGALKGSVNLGELAENNKLLDQLAHSDVGLPTESSKGGFNVSARQVYVLFKSSGVDKRAMPAVRQLQSNLTQAYYRYLSAYNKFALAEQTVAARKQEIELSDSDSEKQRAAADLAQSQNELDATKDDLRSSEMELAAASSPSAARSVISRVAGIAPSVETLAQGAAQNGFRNTSQNHTNKITGFFDSVFKHPHAEAAEANTNSDLPENPEVKSTAAINHNKKIVEKSEAKEGKLRLGLFGRRPSHSQSSDDLPENTAKRDSSTDKGSDSDLTSAPAAKPAAAPLVRKERPASATNTNISFLLKNVSVNPRKSVLTVVVKNSGSETFELNPDAIYIAEGTHKLGSEALRAEFDLTSIEPNQEVKGTITILSRPWNDRLVIYLADGNKTVQLKR